MMHAPNQFSKSVKLIIIHVSSSAGTTFDITVPFTYNLPNSTANLVYTGRKIEDEHSAVFEMIEDLLNK